MSSLEAQKLYYDLVKHLTTLSSGSILLIATLVDKLFATPHYMWLIVIVLISFLFSITAGLCGMYMTCVWIAVAQLDDAQQSVLNNSTAASIVAFIFGYLFFLIFFLLNTFA